jgi:DNA-nicking Smr family endonuclease
VKHPQLDLHGVKHEEVANTVKRFIEDIFQYSVDGHYNIITGLSPKMRELVVEEVNRYGVFGMYFVPGVVTIFVKE